jgi:hypothetical protein
MNSILAFLYKLHEILETSAAGLEIPKLHVARAHFQWLLRLQVDESFIDTAAGRHRRHQKFRS